MLRRFLFVGLMAPLLLLIVILGAFLGLAGSEGGSRWLIGVTAQLAPGKLTVGRIDGTLLDRIDLYDVRYQHTAHELGVKHARLHWRPLALLDGIVQVRQILADGIRYRGPEPVPSDSDAPPALPEIRLPLAVRLEELLVVDVELRQGDTTHSVQRVAVAADADARSLRIGRLEAVVAPFEVRAQGQLAPAPPYPAELALSWSASLADGKSAAGEATVVGDLQQLQLEHKLTGPFLVGTQGVVTLSGLAPSVELAGDWQDLHWPLTGKPQYTSAHGSYRLQGELEDYQLRLDALVAGADLPEVQARLEGHGNVNGLELDTLSVHGLDGELTARGQLSWSPQLAWVLDIDATDIDPGTHWTEWPGKLSLTSRVSGLLSDERTAVSIDLKHLQGTLQGQSVQGALNLGLESAKEAPRAAETQVYRLRGDGSLTALGLPPFAAELESTVDPMTGMDLGKLTLRALDGTLIAQGKVAWSPAPEWALDVTAIDVNPGTHWPDWPGTLALNARVSGRLEDGELAMDADVRRLAGLLRNYPVQGTGRLALKGESLRARGLELSSGRNRVRLEGTAGQRLNLEFEVDAPQLEELWPGLGGRVQAKGHLDGARSDPRIAARLDAAGIRLNEYGVDALELDLKVDPARPDVSYARLEAREIRAPGQVVSQLSLEGTGGREQHRWETAIVSPHGTLAASLSGRYREARWDALLQRADLNLTHGGLWRLQQPVSLAIGAERVHVGQACWAQREARACSSADWQAKKGLRAEGEIHALPLALTQALLPTDWAVDGLLDAQFEVTDTAGALKARAEVLPRPGSLTLPVPDGEPLRIAYRDAKAIAAFQDDVLTLDLGLAVAEQGKVEGTLRLGPATGEHGSRPLRGRVQAGFPDLALLSGFVPTVDQMAGSLTLDVSLGGTLETPAIEGNASIEGGYARLPDLGLELQDMMLTARNQGSDQVVFRAEATSGDGKLTIDGDAKLSATEGWPVRARVRGKDFSIVRLPQAQATASPDLSINVREGRGELTGTLTIPEAKIEIKELPQSAVRVSPDEVIVGDAEVDGEASPAARAGAGPASFSSRVELVLGDKVRFSGFGLKTNLTGRMEVSRKPGGIPLAQGRLSLEKGRYRAYGQNLKIDRGRLLFAGPVDNPYVNIEATRKAGKVTAGVRLEGPLKAPRARVFSDPAMAEAEALSYLLRGKPLGGTQTDEGNALAEAAMSMGLARSGFITQPLSESLGLDEMTVQSDENLEQSALQIGKYLTPDLYVGYALGLFDRQGLVELRYKLTESLSLKTQSGASQSMDLIYTIERE